MHVSSADSYPLPRTTPPPRQVPVLPPPRQNHGPLPPPLPPPRQPAAMTEGVLTPHEFPAAPPSDWLSVVDRWTGKPSVRGLALSVAFHTALMLVLGAAVIVKSVPSEPIALDVTFEETIPDEPVLIDPQVLEVVPAMEVAVEVAPSSPLGIVEDVGGGIEVAIDLEVLSGPTVGAGNRLTEPGFGALGNGLGDAGKLTAPSTEFFGIPARGDRFVFVVDGSGSMGDQFRIDRAKDELEKSIRRLKDYQQFYVIFFNQSARPMPEKGLVPATPQKIDEAVAWMRQIHPDGFTDPRSALLRARLLKPDAIFLLSDGAFDPLVATELTKGHRKRTTPIHTIAFTNRAGEQVLKLIANRTGGMYRFVP